MAEPTRSLTSGRTLARNAVWNIVGLGAPMLVAVVTIPILIGTLGADRFGVLNLAWLVVGYLSLFDFGLGRALTRVVAEKLGTERPAEIPALFWTSLGFMAVLGLVGMAVGLALSSWLVDAALKVPVALRPETRHAFSVLALSLPFDITTDALRGTLEAHQRFRLTSLLRIAMGLCTFLAPIAVLPFSHSLVAVVAALLVARIAVWAAHLLCCFHVVPGLRRGAILDLAAARPLLRVGGWMTVSNLVSPLMEFCDRFLLGALISVTAVTYYATPFDAVTKLLVIPSALTGVVFPAFAASYATDRARTGRLLQRALTGVFLAVFPFVLAVTVLAHEGLRVWLGGEFAGRSTGVLQWLAVGVLANSLAQVPFALIQGAGRPDLTAKLHLIELPAYLAAIWWLVRLDGIEGAAIAWTLRVAVDLLLLLLASRRLLASAMPVKREVVWTGGAAALILAAATLPTGWAGKTAFLLVSLLAYAVVAWGAVQPQLVRSEGRRLPRSVRGLRSWAR